MCGNPAEHTQTQWVLKLGNGQTLIIDPLQNSLALSLYSESSKYQRSTVRVKTVSMTSCRTINNSSAINPVIIVGAGLTGLSAALTLHRQSVPFIVFESLDQPGGRVSHDTKDGFILDRGFQVFLTPYPEIKRICDLKNELGARCFTNGAIILGSNGQHRRIFNPIRHPFKFLSSIFNSPLSFRDLPSAIRLAFCLAWAPATPGMKTGISIFDYLGSLSKGLRNSLLAPFFRGVFLDPDLGSDSSLFNFYLRCFATGEAVLLPGGAGSFAAHLCSLLPKNSVRLGATVTQLSSTEVTLASGEVIHGRSVILTVPEGPRERLLKKRITNGITFRDRVVTFYFAAPKTPFPEPLLALNPDSTGVINHLTVLTNVAPTYSQSGQALVSVISLYPELANEEIVRRELSNWFGKDVEHWSLLSEWISEKPLPLTPELGEGWREVDGVFVAGDDLSYGSQNGALAAGRAVANAVISAAV